MSTTRKPSPREIHVRGPDHGLCLRLEETLAKEAELLRELRLVFRRQREALVTGDAERLDDGVFAATRLMRTLDEARSSRRRVTVGLIGTDVDFLELDDVLSGVPISTSLPAAREAVLDAARELRREVSVLRSSLHVLLDDNRRCLDALLGVEGHRFDAPSGGAHGASPADRSRKILDRRA